MLTKHTQFYERTSKKVPANNCRKLFLSAFLLFFCSVISMAQPLSGTKTINPSGSGVNNYTTFTLAVNDLVAKGVGGPVTFNVSSGTYTEQLLIPSITGSSVTNTITFQSLTNDSNAVNLQFASTTTNNYVVLFQNADNITFRKMSVQSTSTTNGNATTFSVTPSSAAEDCQNIRILNCRLSSIWGTSNLGAVVRASGKSTGLKVKRNAIGNSFGIYIQGQSTSGQYTTGIELDSNVFATMVHPASGSTQEVFEPIYVQYTLGMKIRFNKFTKTGCCADDLIQMYNSESFEISYNRSDMSGGTYAITLSSSNLLGSTFSQVYNNYFHFSYASGTLLRVVNSRYIKIYHNNLLHDATGSANRGIYVDNGASGSDIQIFNNIINVTNGTPLVIDRIATVNDLDHNVYWPQVTGSALATIAGVSYADLNSLKGKVYSGSDNNSLVKDPLFVSASNLDTRGTCLVGKNGGLATDIYMVARNSTPTIGAKEVVATISNDIATEQIISPLSPITPGAQDLEVQVRNYGTNTVNTYDISYILNGGTPVTLSISTPLAQCQSANHIFTGTNQPTFGSSNNIAIYTSNPNGTTDQNKLNDTIKANICGSLAGGTYTIDPAGSGSNNFTSFTNAVDRMSCGGITGAVVFNVAAGTYTEQISLGGITGSSSTNTITFVGASKTSVILTYAATLASSMYTVRIIGSQYITFRNMTIRATGTTYGWVMNIQNSNNNNLRNCLLEITGAGTTSTSTNFMGVVLNGSHTTYSAAGTSANNIIDSCEINSGYYNIYCYTASATTVNYYRNNILRDGYSASAYFNSAQTIKFIGNTLTPRTSNANNDGLVLFNGNSNSPQFHEIKNNRIWNAGNRGIYMATSTGSSGSLYGEIVNNMIGGGFRSTVPYGIYTTSSRWVYYHNTIYLNAPGTGAARAYMQTTSGNNNIHVNNIFAVGTGNVSAVPVEFGATANSTLVDYNNYYNYSAPALIRIVGVDYDNTTLKNFYPSGGGVNSMSNQPQFIGPLDLHLPSTYDAPAGDVTLGITTDIDGDTRCPGTYTIGADQSNFPQLIPAANFVMPDTVYENSPTRIVNTTKGSPNQYTYTWYIDGLWADNKRDLDFNFTAAGAYVISLVVNGCAGHDSVGQQLTVIVPTVTPVSDFVADRQVVDLFTSVYLRDISKFGPDTWTWSATPAASSFISNVNDQHPYVFFDAPGYYDICLSTENANGPGTDLCKNSYIFVKEEFNMCSSGPNAISSARFGKLFDDGGPSAAYSTNRNCTFLIDPCATSVTLKFSSFVLGAGDILYVYDGSDANGTLLGSFSSTTTGLPGGTTGLIASSGKMFIRWTTDAATQAAGFAAEWSAVANNTAPPVAGFSFPDTIYTDEVATFTSTTAGSNLNFSWDFDPPNAGPGYEGGNKAFDTYSYANPGSYNVLLRVGNCAGSSTITRSVLVIDPVSTPVVDFVADRTLAPVSGIVNLTDKSTQGPLNFRWVITPSIGVNITPSKTSRNISVTFFLPGVYTVKHVAGNILGEDSIEKVGYITIYDYCDPAVATLDGKTGISNVTFGAINNTSPVATSTYSNYSNGIYATVLHGETYPISISRTNTSDDMNRKIWIDWNIDGDFNDSLEMVAFESASRTLTFVTGITIPRFAFEGKTRMRVGVSYGNTSNKPCGLNPVGEFEDYTVEVTADRIAPVITLSGATTVNFEQWYQYVEPGFTAIDNVDSNITSVVVVSSTVDSTVVGSYLITYQVSDLAGNTAMVTRTVNVTPDVTAPQITLNGSATMNHTVNTTFNDPGAVATDYFNRSLTSSIATTSNVNTFLTGSYTITYEVTDAAGNTSVINRTVSVIDDVAPVISMVGDTVFMEVNTSFVEPGVSATDNYDANVTVVSGTVNTNITGTYTMTYTSTDLAGNKTTATRVVVVRDTQAPLITLIGLDTLILDVFSNYFEYGAKVTDNYCNGLTADINSPVNTSKVGTYIVTYDATDCKGNIAITKNRVVKVVDRIAPVLQLRGLISTTKIDRWKTYSDSGVIYTDNYYSKAELDPLLIITSNVNTQVAGFYEYCYDLTDPSGNVAQRVCRMVQVLENTTGISDKLAEESVNVYPNPGNGLVNVAVKFENMREVEISIVNVLGEIVATVEPEQVVENTFLLDLSSQAAGVYMIRIKSGDQLMTKRLIIQH